MRTMVLKRFRGSRDHLLKWIWGFGAFEPFTPDKDVLSECTIGYVLTRGVSLQVETGFFIAAPNTSPCPSSDGCFNVINS